MLKIIKIIFNLLLNYCYNEFIRNIEKKTKIFNYRLSTCAISSMA